MIDHRVIALRKLAYVIPTDSASLNGVLAQSGSEFDPRGRVPKREDTLRNVFIDHICICALTLGRGRPITRRVPVASSPLYQPMDEAERLGNEVRVYARVPDTGGGQDRGRDTDDSSGAQARALSRSLAVSARHSSTVTPTGNHGSSSNSNTSPGTTARYRYRK
ncbi:hypothetical protein PLICRDRAFT_172960 [Plicaturopsis crispa FD-325 SS-3]|nr:hypothetical protein PLICRDRAFT_172960 [Plicaturopsis crispa FD-325 SS-3]